MPNDERCERHFVHRRFLSVMSKLSDIYEIKRFAASQSVHSSWKIESHHKTWFVYISHEFINMMVHTSLSVAAFFSPPYTVFFLVVDPSKRSTIYIWVYNNNKQLDRISVCANGKSRKKLQQFAHVEITMKWKMWILCQEKYLQFERWTKNSKVRKSNFGFPFFLLIGLIGGSQCFDWKFRAKKRSCLINGFFPRF